MAEEEGFEPSVRWKRTTVFETAPFDRSGTPPARARIVAISFQGPNFFQRLQRMAGFTPERIISLANQIASNQLGYPEQEAARITAEHINLFWQMDMRQQLLDLGSDKAESAKLHSVVRAALASVRGRPPADS